MIWKGQEHTLAVARPAHARD
jgi:hypothetical protein